MIDSFSQALSEGSLLAFVLAFVSGILASLTPCVYPVIPITVTFISGRAKSHLHAVWLSVIYVTGMAMTYAALGVFAALTGKVFGKITMTPSVFFIVGGILFFFGLIQIEWIRIPVPRTLSNLGGGRGGALVMGITSGFVVAPCTVPLLGAILTFIATSRSLVYGALMMFCFALGMGLLFLGLGIFTGLLATLPKSGRWLVVIEKGTAVLFFLLSGYFIYRGMALLS